jgi:hypothetical protein
VEDILLYQTSDSEFANRAVAALQKAGIGCCQRGRGWSFTQLPRLISNSICICIHDRRDYERANRIIIGLGAYVDPPLQFRHRRLLLLLAGLVLTVVAMYVVRQ